MLRLYLCVAKSLEGYFLSHKLSLPIGSDGIDVTRPDISRLLKQVEHSQFGDYLDKLQNPTQPIVNSLDLII